MTYRRPQRILVAIAAATLAMAACAQPDAGPLVRPELTRQVAPHVHVIPDMSVPGVPNVGIVVGDKAALVIDTGMGPRNGAMVLAEARNLAGDRPLYLVTTHVHPEHDLGAQAFPASVKLIRSADEESDIAEFGLSLAETFSQRSTANAMLLEGATFRPADIRFTDRYALDLGGVRVAIMAMGPNHTRGDTAIFVEQDKVLFSGDIAMRAQPAFASPYSSVDHWLASLDRLEALHPRVIVPSHGPIGDQAFLRDYRTYLLAVRERTAPLKRQGKSADEAVALVSAAMQPAYSDSGRLQGAIRAAYREAH